MTVTITRYNRATHQPETITFTTKHKPRRAGRISHGGRAVAGSSRLHYAVDQSTGKD